MLYGTKKIMQTRERLECLDCGGHDILIVKDICDVPECESEIFAKRLCKAHYNRAWRILKAKAEQEREGYDESFWKQVDQFTRDRRKP